ncbi:hypothetical protein BaRGS_00027757 [Batillaria attramentaria]|uniref:Uncharacterized protein n=1 Tax=Batillaria attramentaria TaxID=370345 RepID=A0ABD0K1J4_9CAEN
MAPLLSTPIHINISTISLILASWFCSDQQVCPGLLKAANVSISDIGAAAPTARPVIESFRTATVKKKHRHFSGSTVAEITNSSRGWDLGGLLLRHVTVLPGPCIGGLRTQLWPVMGRPLGP